MPTGCSNRAAHHQLAKRIDESEARLQDELDKIKRTVEASYQRERAMAERLQLAEEANARLRQELLEQEEQIRQLGSPSRDSGTFSADDSYRRAKARYDDGGYERALTGFAEILSRAPRHALADNAQYWVMQ